MKKTRLLQTLLGLGLLVSLLASACGSKDIDATPTFSVEQAQTLAVVTFSSALTQTAMAVPTNTSTPTFTPSPTATITLAVTRTPGTPGAGAVPTSSCYSMAFVSDVSIPDNTSMKPGQSFTKTWRVRNNGTCVWESGFKFSFIGGEALSGAALTLDKAVSPGTETELSVAMTAPNTAGSYRSNWRMSNATGTFFGDEVYVIIAVGGSTSTSSTSTATSAPVSASATPTATETPTDTLNP